MHLTHCCCLAMLQCPVRNVAGVKCEKRVPTCDQSKKGKCLGNVRCPKGEAECGVWEGELRPCRCAATTRSPPDAVQASCMAVARQQQLGQSHDRAVNSRDQQDSSMIAAVTAVSGYLCVLCTAVLQTDQCCCCCLAPCTR